MLDIKRKVLKEIMDFADHEMLGKLKKPGQEMPMEEESEEKAPLDIQAMKMEAKPEGDEDSELDPEMLAQLMAMLEEKKED